MSDHSAPARITFTGTNCTKKPKMEREESRQQDNMHPVNVMLRCIVRSLYDTEHVVILELLIHFKRLTAKEMAAHLHLSQVELNRKCHDLCSELLISSQADALSGKPRYYIDFKTALFAVGARLKGMRRIVDANKDPMEEETMECRNCELKLAMNKLYYPIGENGFDCPWCSNVLAPLSSPGSSDGSAVPTITEDLNYFFGLLQAADKAYRADFPGEVTSWSYNEI